MEPKIIKKDEIIIAGVCGSGYKTAELWEEFDRRETGVKNKLSDDGYEVRIYSDESCKCHVGASISNTEGNEGLDMLRLPPSEYAVFDVIVAEGYDSQNEAMDRWIENNPGGYAQSKLDGDPFVVEHYDERFKPDDPDSIVEIWVPITKG
ncbi:MAG: effector binding domain-containing protein [Thermoplasmata archaeon]